jgi:hypothetical protein
MARGWESKSVEQQQAEKSEHSQVTRAPVSPEEQKLNRKREGLILSRERLAQELKTASNPRRLQMLQQAIDELDRQLSSLTANPTANLAANARPSTETKSPK